uniref:glycosyltransferase family 25 protein n=1 Tax=Escherichia coli TaxID=562 RepID=UPI00208E0926
AIDAKDPQNKEIIDKMRLSGVGAEMTDGEIACTLSHQLIYQDMIDKNIEWASSLKNLWMINLNNYLEKCLRAIFLL